MVRSGEVVFFFGGVGGDDRKSNVLPNSFRCCVFKSKTVFFCFLPTRNANVVVDFARC